MIARNRGLGSFIGHQVMALEESAGYVPHDPLDWKVGKVYVNGTGEPECIMVRLGFLGSRPVLLRVETVAVDEGRRTLTLE